MIGSARLLNGINEFFSRRKIASGVFEGYSFTPDFPATYWASAYPALTYSLVGLLRETDDFYLNEWASFLKAGQNETTGLYNEPLNNNNFHENEIHSIQDIYWHGATFINGALHVLGHKPAHPFKCLEKYRSPGEMTRWIESLPWENPWKTGNRTYDMGCLMGTDKEITGNIDNLITMDEFFDWMDNNTDRETGWWNPVGTAPLFSQQFGGYHTLMVYWMFNREVPDPEKMIASTLRLQTDDGSYSGFGCCGDMDAVDTLVSLSRQYDICGGEVKKSIERFLPYLLNTWDQEGGFRGLENASHSDYGWTLHTGITGMADPCSTYFRTFTLALVNEILEIPQLDGVKWKHMDGYCHGRRPDKLLNNE